MKNRNAYLKDENLITLFSLNNLIIPEIQREYVWGNNSDVLENFLKGLESVARPCDKCHYAHVDKNVNVGFLYSYKPQYVVYEHERILDEYLIDGQQRITTLFLLLLYRASIEERMDDFISIFRIDDNILNQGFNYKVRQLTQQFISELINHAKINGKTAFDFISEETTDYPSWFLNDYKSDPTVKSMMKALVSIKKVFGSKENYYFDFLLINVRFWHFKTDVTSQGEELYITMNSRGEQLTDNEMKKARTLPKDQLISSGQKWENWQTVFWRNRHNNADNYNSDKGFNNYLNIIEGIEWFMGTTDYGENPSVDTIERYIMALEYVNSEDFANFILNEYNGLYIEWFKILKSEIWEQINTGKDNWMLVNPKGKGEEEKKEYNNSMAIRNKSMLFWPWMYYLKTTEPQDIDNLYLVRLLHFYYVRYFCYKRSATTIRSIVDLTRNNSFVLNNAVNQSSEEDDDVNAKFFSDEEIMISGIENRTPESRKIIESKIWKIQDLPYIKDGKFVGGNTIIGYLKAGVIDEANIEEGLDGLYSGLKFLLPDGNDYHGNIIAKRLLLFYKNDNVAFWATQSPYYYTNYETSSWKRIVRTPHFISLVADVLDKRKNGIALTSEELLEEKRVEFFNEHNCINRNSEPLSHRKLCILYDALKSDGIWDWNNYDIVFRKDNENVDELFSEQLSLWKCRRYIDYNARIALDDNWRDVLKKYGVEVIEKNNTDVNDADNQ